MCGITAFLLFPQHRSPRQWQAIKKVFTSILVNNEVRGTAATGVALITTEGNLFMCKGPIAASQFTTMSGYTEVLSRVRDDAILLVGHTRLPTKGDASNNANNQPLQAGAVIGVHNGHISNDDELFGQLRCGRSGEVDSEIIFRLIGSVDPRRPANQYLAGVQAQICRLRGQYTFLAADRRKPSQLLALKHGNPLSAHFHAEWGAVVFSSRYGILRNTFGVGPRSEALAHDSLMLYDAHCIPGSGVAPLASLPALAQGL